MLALRSPALVLRATPCEQDAAAAERDVLAALPALRPNIVRVRLWCAPRRIDLVRRVLALPHINGDLSKVNIDPDRREEILRRYGAADLQAA